MKISAQLNLQRHITPLRSLLGTEVTHLGVRCRLLEILEDVPALVLEDCEANTSIQEDQYGGVWRRVPTNYTIPLVTADGCSLHPFFMALKLPLDSH